jgi:sugar lactone lactonase YvrE
MKTKCFFNGMIQTMRYAAFGVFLVLTACGSSPQAVPPPEDAGDGIPLRQAIEEAAARIEERLPEGTKVALLNFDSPSDMFSEYVLEELSAILVNNGRLIIVDRKEIDLIRGETDFQWSGEVSDTSAQEIGQLLGAQSIISGSLSSMGNIYRFRIKALNVQTARIEVQYPADVVTDNRVKTLLASGKSEPVTASGNRTSGSSAFGGQPEAAGSPESTATPPLNQASGPAAQTGVPTLNPASSPSPPTAAPANRGASVSYERFTALRKLDSVPTGVSVFTPDSKGILASSGGYVKLWDAETGKEIRTIRESRGFSHIAISPDGRRFITYPDLAGNKILLWDLASGAYRECTGHSSGVTSLAFSPDGNFFISGSWNKTIKIWDAETGQEVKTLTGHTGNVHSVSYSPDGRQIVSCSNDKTIKFWDAESGNAVRSVSANCTIVAYCPDGRKIAAVERTRIYIFDTQNGQKLFTLTGHRAVIQTIAFSPDGSRLLSLDQGNGNNLLIWNMSNGWETGRLASSVKDQPIGSLMVSPDGKYFAIGRAGSSITIWGEK